MAFLVTMFLSAASFLLVMATSHARASESARPLTEKEVVLSPEERDLVLTGRIVLRTLPDTGLSVFRPGVK